MKTIFKILLFIMVFAGAFFTGLIGQMVDMITFLNTNVIAYIPTSIRVFIIMIVFVVLIWLSQAFS